MSLASDDLAAARLLLDAPRQLHNACFHAQAAAEKALKALLLSYHIPYPKTHNVEYLIDLVRQSYPDFPTFAEEAATLNEYGVEARYDPRLRHHIDRAEAEQAIGFAEAIMARCQEAIEKG